jgi:hypothetical protein
MSIAAYRLVLLLYESWATLDRNTEGMTEEHLTTRKHGGSSIAWTLGHVTNMLDSWINVRFQGLSPDPVVAVPNFRAGGNGDAVDWTTIHTSVGAVRSRARQYLDSDPPPDLEAVVPYDGSIRFLRPSGLRLSYALMRIAAHHLMHAGEVESIRVRLGHPAAEGQDWGRALA